MKGNPYLYILSMAAVSYLVRVLPLTLIRGEIRSRFLKSFLYYVPYVTLSVMTFPAILSATANPITYEKAVPVFIDSDYETWNMSPEALECAFEKYPDVKLIEAHEVKALVD